MLNYREFTETVKEEILNYLPAKVSENAQVCINTVVRNDDGKLTLLCIFNGKSGISPNLYLEDFYKEYESGTTFEYLMKIMADIYLSIICKPSMISSFMH